MDYKQIIETLTNDITDTEPDTYRKKIKLYLAGICAKLRNAEFSLKNLNTYNNMPDNTPINDDYDLNAGDRIFFFTDSFFAFLYSAYDVTAQVINQKLRLGIDEFEVSIKKVKHEIDTNHTRHRLVSPLNKLIRARHFKNLDKYRNCSTHRREIYIQTQRSSVSETPGYSQTGEINSVKRYLCDDPLTLKPTIKQRRDLINYMSKLFDRVPRDIIEILKNI